MTAAATTGRLAMTVDEVADAIQVRPEYVRLLLRRGELDGKKVGQTWRITPKAVHRYLEG